MARPRPCRPGPSRVRRGARAHRSHGHERRRHDRHRGRPLPAGAFQRRRGGIPQCIGCRPRHPRRDDPGAGRSETRGMPVQPGTLRGRRGRARRGDGLGRCRDARRRRGGACPCASRPRPHSRGERFRAPCARARTELVGAARHRCGTRGQRACTRPGRRHRRSPRSPGCGNARGQTGAPVAGRAPLAHRAGRTVAGPHRGPAERALPAATPPDGTGCGRSCSRSARGRARGAPVRAGGTARHRARGRGRPASGRTGLRGRAAARGGTHRARRRPPPRYADPRRCRQALARRNCSGASCISLAKAG